MKLSAATRRENASLTRRLLVMVAGSFAFGFALVPLYDVICEAAGIRVNAVPSGATEGAATDRRVALEFMSIVAPGGEWELTPLTRETVVAARARSTRPSSRSAAGRPCPSPDRPCRAWRRPTPRSTCRRPSASASRRSISARREEREFTVRFIVDPDLPPQVDRMTLAYSMYTLPAQKLAAR